MRSGQGVGARFLPGPEGTRKVPVLCQLLENPHAVRGSSGSCQLDPDCRVSRLWLETAESLRSAEV
eukprot:200867-Rhodomonas_salina.1